MDIYLLYLFISFQHLIIFNNQIFNNINFTFKYNECIFIFIRIATLPVD